VESAAGSDTILGVHVARRSPVRAARTPRQVATRVLVGLALVVAALWLLLLRPPILGGSTSYVIVSGSSMDPTLHDGDLVVVRERDSYEIGDVVAFRFPDDQVGPDGDVIHRIVGGSAAEGYITRGDNREAEDQWRVAPDDILGRYVGRVPRVGAVLHWLAQPLVLGLMVGAALASLYWILRIHRAPEERVAARPEPTPVSRSTPPGRNGSTPEHAPAPEPAPVAATVGPDAEPGGHDVVATRIRERYERADPETRVKIRQLVFEQAMRFRSEDPNFDTAAFLRACGAHAYER
jgi:signal peptidase I